MNPIRVLVVSASLSARSRSRVLARGAHDLLATDAITQWLDLADLDLQPYPLSKGEADATTVRAAFEAADAMVLATPVYNWGAAAQLTNMLHYALDPDHGRRHRPFVLIASAGSTRSHLALDGVARAMLLETHGIQVGPPIIGTGVDVDPESGRINGTLTARIDSAMAVLVRHAHAAHRAEQPSLA